MLGLLKKAVIGKVHRAEVLVNQHDINQLKEYGAFQQRYSNGETPFFSLLIQEESSNITAGKENVEWLRPWI